MQPIHISRYEPGGQYQGTVVPEDRSWILWVDKNGEPTLWRRVRVPADPKARADEGVVLTMADAESTGDTIDGYIPDIVYSWPEGVPMPEHVARMVGE